MLTDAAYSFQAECILCVVRGSEQGGFCRLRSDWKLAKVMAAGAFSLCKVPDLDCAVKGATGQQIWITWVELDLHVC